MKVHDPWKSKLMDLHPEESMDGHGDPWILTEMDEDP